MTGQKLIPSFYRRDDVVTVAKELVGKVLCTSFGDTITSGIITETEAYCGRGDRACHANDGTRTERTETMYQNGGIAYVYLCYGIHHLFNVVTNTKDKADAVLIRAIKPMDGIDTMLKRRGFEKSTPPLTAGPGRLTQALNIKTNHDATSLLGDSIWIEDRGLSFQPDQLCATTRVGVGYAGEDAQLPWRFYPRESSWISKK
ncbi:DNA-3-methyladenine glycosylase [Fodinibius halophilus]|uniref:Putative 3-methyladenine DNA glycosylase n=1 Tax=Fodinibius halophilus TaxID=1736908 RepID=A0A6M1TFK0_9BACT|nr:DNA-3-methyladenine glycosylase [Fodinibius halophilus]NGP89544.1 DNA-3-methyladenine glycosylase [Fodinibius halophilus]